MRLKLWLQLTLLAVVGCGCQHQGNIGAAHDQNRLSATLREGTATAEQAETWAREVLIGSGPIDSKERNLTSDGFPARFCCYRGMAGSGGNAYAVFLSGPRGYRYVGILEFGEYCILPSDSQKRPRVATLWFEGIGEGILSVHVLTENGLDEALQRTVVPADVFETPLGGLMANKVLAVFDPIPATAHP